MIIVISGFRGSGKSLFGRLAKKMKYVVFEMSTPILALMKELGIEITNENVRNFATNFREIKGIDAVAKLIISQIKFAMRQEKNIVIIGARSIKEIEVFRSISQVVTIAIISDEKTRFARTSKRRNLSDPTTLQAFKWADEVEIKWGLKKLIDKSEIKIDNNGTEEEFAYKVKSILKKYA